jgi:monoamine oxidase
VNANGPDVIVVGAGVAGLTAAEVLCKAGLAVTILEARDRIGGRILTKFDPECGFPIELGAEFIHGRPPIVLNHLKQEGLRIREIKGQAWCSEVDDKQNSRLVPCGDFWHRTERILKQMRYRKSGDDSFTSFLQSAKMRRYDEEDKARATAYVEGFNAARADDVSVNWLVRSIRAEEEIDGNHQFRIVGGYEALVQAIRKKLDAKKVRMLLNTVVTKMRWGKRAVEITARCNGREVILPAARALITLPLGVLQSRANQPGAVQFEPALREKQRAIGKLKMGGVVRVSLRFRERFWNEIKPHDPRQFLSRMTFLFSRDELFPTWWTAFPETSPVLTAWSPSWHTRKLKGRTHSHIAREALTALSRILPVSREFLSAQLVDAYVHDWQSDPFSRGAYSYAMVGGDSAPELLAKPVQDTLFFAGEATATDGHNGTVHGAMTSGERAAKELLDSLKA